jgi:alkanesulfonate monooxygenase
MRPLEFGWYLPTHGDTTAYGLVEAQIPGSPELCERVVQAAEKAGFEYLLIPVGSVCWKSGSRARSWRRVRRPSSR